MSMPALTTDQMIEVDRLMIEDYSITEVPVCRSKSSRRSIG